MAANPQTKPVDLGCESAENWQLSSTSTIAIVIITQPLSWYSFYRPAKGGRLSRPKHCSKGAQPVLKTVYRSSCRDKHNCRDSNLGPLTPQSDTLTTRLLRPALCPVMSITAIVYYYLCVSSLCPYLPVHWDCLNLPCIVQRNVLAWQPLIEYLIICFVP